MPHHGTSTFKTRTLDRTGVQCHSFYPYTFSVQTSPLFVTHSSFPSLCAYDSKGLDSNL